MKVTCKDTEEGRSGTLVEVVIRSPEANLSLVSNILVARRNGHDINLSLTVIDGLYMRLSDDDKNNSVTVNVMSTNASLTHNGSYVINVTTGFKWNNFEEGCDLMVYREYHCFLDRCFH